MLVEKSLPLGVFMFGFPMAVGMVIHTAFNLIDMFMVSRLPEATEALAAIGVCDMLAAAASIVSTGIGTATVARVSRALGQGDDQSLKNTTIQSVLMTLLLSLVFGATGIFASELLVIDVMGLSGEAAKLAVSYLKVMLGGSYSILFLLQLTAVLRGLGSAKTAAVLVVFGAVLNIALNAVFIYGPDAGPGVFSFGAPIASALSIPRYGVPGAAIATVLARTIPVVMGAVIVAFRMRRIQSTRLSTPPESELHKRSEESQECSRERALLDVAEWRTLFSLAWPQSAQLLLRAVGTLVVIGVVATFLAPQVSLGDSSKSGQALLAAVSVCLRLETLILFVGMGWGAAASTYVGANLGAQNRQRAARSGIYAALYCVAFAAVLVVALHFYGELFIALMDDTPDVIRFGTEYLAALAWSYVFLAGGITLSQAMAGAGATKTSFLTDALVLVPSMVAYWIVARFYPEPHALWICVAISNAVSALAFVLVYKRGRFWDETPSTSPPPHSGTLQQKR